jgi:hypothetical protein
LLISENEVWILITLGMKRYREKRAHCRSSYPCPPPFFVTPREGEGEVGGGSPVWRVLAAPVSARREAFGKQL